MIDMQSKQLPSLSKNTIDLMEQKEASQPIDCTRSESSTMESTCEASISSNLSLDDQNSLSASGDMDYIFQTEDNVQHAEIQDEEETFPARRSSIRFSNEIQYHTIQSLDDFTQEEKDASYYQEEDFLFIREEAQDCVLEAENFGEEDMPEELRDSIRGLESFSESKAERIALHIFLALESVLDEQDYQDETGDYDVKAIAKAYRTVSLRCRYPARKRALQDRKDIENC